MLNLLIYLHLISNAHEFITLLGEIQVGFFHKVHFTCMALTGIF